MRRLLFSALGLVSLAACAPRVFPVTGPGAAPEPVTATPSLRAAFAPEGVTWVSAGQACVARAPSYRPVCPKLPGAAVDVAWNGGDAWAALPGVGLLLTLDRAARVTPAGRVVALSGTRAYREDGSAVTYEGAAAAGVPGAPSAAVTGGDGQDYVLLAGTLRRVADGAVLDPAPAPLLQAAPDGARTTLLPSAFTPLGTYRLTGTALQRLDPAGRVLASVPHGPGRVGLVGNDVVTVSPEGDVRTFGVDLRPLTR